jgi:hypothetical protein
MPCHLAEPKWISPLSPPVISAEMCSECSVGERGGCIWEMCSAEQVVNWQYCCKVCVMGQMSTMVVLHRQYYVNDSTQIIWKVLSDSFSAGQNWRMKICVSSGEVWFKLGRNVKVKWSKGIPQQAEVALGVPGRLRPRIFSTFGTTRVVGRQPNAPAAFTPGEIPGTHFQRLSCPQGTWFCRKEPRKKIPSYTTGDRSQDRPTRSRNVKN